MARWRSALQCEWSLVKAAGEQWSAHNAQRLGAALAYYTILSLAPLLIIFVSLAGLVFGENAVRGQISWQVQSVLGAQGAAFILTLLKDAKMHSTSGIIASLLGFAILLFGASSIFIELRDDLNYIWDVPPRQGSILRGLLDDRLRSFGLVIACGLLIAISLAASIVFHAAETFALAIFPIPGAMLELINFVITFLVTTLLFGMIYTVVPERRVAWTDVAVGSVVTAALFAIGKSLVALYLGRAGVGSLYGAAGSLVVLLVWVYYSYQIFLFGAEFTHVYSQRHGVLRDDCGAQDSDTRSTVSILTAQHPTRA